MRTEKVITTSITLPAPLLAHLKKIARAEGRSLSSQVRIFLTTAVAPFMAKTAGEHPGQSTAA